jgi:hypothetical protein
MDKVGCQCSRQYGNNKNYACNRTVNSTSIKAGQTTMNAIGNLPACLDIFISVCPNPFNDKAVVKTDLELTDASCIIYNITGQEVRRVNNVYGSQIVLFRNNLLKGIYLIKIVQEDKFLSTEKIIVSD